MKRGTHIRLDDSVYRRKIKKLVAKLKVDERTLVMQQGALHAMDMGKYTPPYVRYPSGNISKLPLGTDADADQGQQAIRSDVLNICRPKARGYIGFCAKNFGVGQVVEKIKKANGQEYSIEYARIGYTTRDIYQWHENHRRPSDGRTTWRQSINCMWVPEDVLEEYLEWRERGIGIAKASLAGAAKRLNPKVRVPGGIKPWIRRHVKRAGGRGKVAHTKKGYTAIYRARAAGLQTTARAMSKVTRGRLIAMESQLRYKLRKSAKASGLRVR